MNEKAPLHYARLVFCSGHLPEVRDKNAIYLLKAADGTIKAYPFTFVDKELKTLIQREQEELQTIKEVKFPTDEKQLCIERAQQPDLVEKIISVCGLASLESDIRSLQAFHDWGTMDAADIIKNFAVNSIEETKNLTDSSGYDLLLMSIYGDDLPEADTLKPPVLIKQQNNQGNTLFYIFGYSNNIYKLTQLSNLPALEQLDFSAERIFIAPKQYKEIYDEITAKKGHIYSVFHKFTDWYRQLARAFHTDRNINIPDDQIPLYTALTQLLFELRSKIKNVWENNQPFDLEEAELAELHRVVDELWERVREIEKKYKLAEQINRRCDKLLDGLEELVRQVKLAEINQQFSDSSAEIDTNSLLQTVSEQKLHEEEPTFSEDYNSQNYEAEKLEIIQQRTEKLLSKFEEFCHLVQEAMLNSEVHNEVEQVFVATDTLRARLNRGNLDKETANSLIIRLESLIEWLQELVKELKDYVNNDDEASSSFWQKTTKWFQELVSGLTDYSNSNYSPSFWQQPIVEASLDNDEELSEESDDSFELKF